MRTETHSLIHVNRWAWRLLLRHWLFMLALLTTGRGVFYLMYREVFSGFAAGRIADAFLAGMRFDLATAFALSGIPAVVLFSLSPWRRRLWVYRVFLALMWAVTAVVFVLVVMDLFYYPHVGRRIAFEVAAMLRDWRQITGMAFKGYTLPTLAGLSLLAGVIAYSWSRAVRAAQQGWRPVRRGSQAAQVVGLALLVVLIGRGGLQSKPLSVDMAFRGPDMALGHLSLNAAFTTVHALGARRNAQLAFYPDAAAFAEARRVLGLDAPPVLPDYPLVQDPVLDAGPRVPPGPPVRPRNLVILVLESFSAQLVGRLGGTPGLLPNVDRISREGVLYSNFFAEGTRSLEGIATVLTGYPALPNAPLIGSSLSQNTLRSLPKILREQGYSTFFLHGAFRGSMWFDHFARLHGFQRYIAKEDFPNPERVSDGTWGIFDHVSLERLHEELSASPRPVFGFFFSLSSHTPYVLPPGETPRFGPETPDAAKLNSYAYVDAALGRFFDQARASNYWRDTVFLITADHNLGSAELGLVDRMRIPLIVLAPGLPDLTPGEVRDVLASQVDMAPTALDLLGITTRNHFVGSSLRERAPRGRRMALLAWGGQAGWLTQEWLLTHDLSKPLGLFRWREDPGLSHNLLTRAGEEPAPVREFQSFLQTVNNLLLTNRVYPERER
ncbi:MAG: LTA synthase family protein [Deltaproteobacteria bacterium]|nr:LTA synthase family protein [Deltaproteobacteria bacterium]